MSAEPSRWSNSSDRLMINCAWCAWNTNKVRLPGLYHRLSHIRSAGGPRLLTIFPEHIPQAGCLSLLEKAKGMFTKKSLWLFLLPGLAGLMIFIWHPSWRIYFSLTDGLRTTAWSACQLSPRLGQPGFSVRRNSLELSLLSAPLIFVLSFILAIMLKSLRERSLPYRNILLMPYLVPSSALMIIWMVLFDYGGVINRLLSLLGMGRVMWLESGALRVPIVLLYVWKNIGFSVVIFSAALQSVPMSITICAPGRRRPGVSGGRLPCPWCCRPPFWFCIACHAFRSSKYISLAAPTREEVIPCSTL